MTVSMTVCPSDEQLRVLLDESAPESELRLLQTHVDGCAACEQRLETLVAGSASWVAAVGCLRDGSRPLAEPVLENAVRRIKAEEFPDAASHHSDSADSLDFLEPPDQPGSIGRLGTYEVSEVIGRGGMGVVLKAFDPALHRVVAVKVLAPYLANNPQAKRRFVREAQAIAAVCHDHVITIHAIDESAAQPKIVMQFVAGQSLQQKLDGAGSLELKEILRIGLQTAAGLAAAHAQGLVHRDVKPSNILLENGIQRVKLTDFGLARAVDDASLTQSGAIAGTPQYMAPEQAQGEAVDYRADLFGLGSVMYAMCVGHSPFRASTTMGVLKRVCHDPPRPIRELNPDIPDWLCDIIMKLLAKSPTDRFQSARQVSELLEQWLAHVQQPSVVSEPSPVEKPPAPRVGPENIDARTIAFQQVSGRTLFYAVLLGMALTFVFGITQRMPQNELLIMSLLGGAMIGFWGVVFLSVLRFIRANFLELREWLRGVGKSDPASGAGGPGIQKRTIAGMSPEVMALLVAAGALALSASPIEAMIIASIGWGVATYFVNARRR